jgi:prevent-host-death family protein
MAEVIGQRELRNDNAEIMRRVAAGESFVVTRNGRPIVDIMPHQSGADRPHRTLAQVQAVFRRLPPIDAVEWYRDRAEDDAVFGSDDPLHLSGWRVAFSREELGVPGLPVARLDGPRLRQRRPAAIG